MRKIVAGLLALCMTLLFAGCYKAPPQENANAAPTPAPTPEAAATQEPENPVKLFVDQFNTACNAAIKDADAAAGEAHTLLPGLLAVQRHVYALQKLLYGPTNLLYTSENLFDGGIYGLLHGSGSVWQTEKETSFSCMLSSGDIVTGAVKDDALEAKQTIETASEVEGEPSAERLVCRGKIVRQTDGWYSCYYDGGDVQCSMLYIGSEKMVFTQEVPADRINGNEWLETSPEQWGGMCLIAEEDTVTLFEQAVTEEDTETD